MYASFIIGIRPFDTTEPIFAILDVVQMKFCKNGKFSKNIFRK